MMKCKELISPAATVSCEVIKNESLFEGETVIQFGIEVRLSLQNVTVSRCKVPDISEDYDFVSSIAKEIADKRIPPSEAVEYVEECLPK